MEFQSAMVCGTLLLKLEQRCDFNCVYSGGYLDECKEKVKSNDVPDA